MTHPMILHEIGVDVQGYQMIQATPLSYTQFVGTRTICLICRPCRRKAIVNVEFAVHVPRNMNSAAVPNSCVHSRAAVAQDFSARGNAVPHFNFIK